MTEKQKANLFTSENQPDPSKKGKKGIRIKHLMRKKIEHDLDEMIGAVMKKVKETGDATALDKLLDRAYGKVPIENRNKNMNMNLTEKQIQEEIDKLKELEKLDESGVSKADSKESAKDTK
jgi:predicted ArsR family transcriptional regulator